MKNKVLPTNSESPFHIDEFFFSTTNPKGIITYGNDVFLRVSGYPKEQTIGAPHNIIRHPDMPRSVFKLFWDTLKADHPIGAYVKNMAANGSYYWVFAFAFPIENGYLSIRFKPSSEIFLAVKQIYAEVLEYEKSGHDIESGKAFLLEKIKSSGFSNYEDFMVKAAINELTARSTNAGSKSTSSSNAKNSDITNVSTKAVDSLNELLTRVSEIQHSSEVLVKNINFVNDGFFKLKFVALNMAISSARFGTLAQGLGVVAKEFRNNSAKIGDSINGILGFTETLTSVIQQCNLKMASLNIQIQMVDFFVKESIQKSAGGADDAFAEMNLNRDGFSSLFKTYATTLIHEVSGMRKQLATLSSQMMEVQKLVISLQVIRQIGNVESARTSEIRETFVHYLDEMNKFIDLVKNAYVEIRRENVNLEDRSKSIISSMNHIAGGVDKIFDLSSANQESPPTELLNAA